MKDAAEPPECSESLADWSGARFLVGDVFTRLATIPDGSIDLIVTSPPFLALRSYLPASGGAGGDYAEGGLRENQPKFRAGTARWDGRPEGQVRTTTSDPVSYPARGKAGWPEAKSLCGIPSLYAFSLAYGRNLLNPAHELEPWRVRNLIAWTRPNPPVGALGDKVRPATSYVTTACTGPTRYFDMEEERTELRPSGASFSGTRERDRQGRGRQERTPIPANPAGAPLLDHWSISTAPYKGSHYATFPEELPRRLISLMCPTKVCRTCNKPSERTSSGWTDCGHDDWRHGTVLDPFAGSGTTLAVAVGMGRRAIGIDLDERNAHLAEQRVGMFLEVA